MPEYKAELEYDNTDEEVPDTVKSKLVQSLAQSALGGLLTDEEEGVLLEDGDEFEFGVQVSRTGNQVTIDVPDEL